VWEDTLRSLLEERSADEIALRPSAQLSRHSFIHKFGLIQSGDSAFSEGMEPLADSTATGEARREMLGEEDDRLIRPIVSFLEDEMEETADHYHPLCVSAGDIVEI
jgi:hypothetical protein